MPYTLTPSTISLFKNCPRCFWLHYRQGWKRPEGLYPSLPYGIDKFLKERADYYRERGDLPPELRKLSEVKLFDHPLLALWRNGKKGIRWKSPAGNMLYGALDDVLERNGKVAVLKYVTRGFPAKKDTASYYQNQLNLYTLLLEKNGFPTEKHAHILFYYPKGMNWRGDVWFEKDLQKMAVSLKDAEKLFEKALETLQKECPKNSCAFCEKR